MGLGLAEPGFHTRCFVEWEEYPRRSIIAGQRAGYFTPAPIWDDLTTFDARPFAGAIDTLLAGYPCQPFSQAGKRLGADDPRHLWPHVARVIRELGDGLRWIFLENVAGHITLGAETVLRELWDMGWTPAAGAFSAAETGAPHERLRWFCVAHRAGRGCGILGDAAQPGRGGHADGGNVDLANPGLGRRAGPEGWQDQQPWGAEAIRSGAPLADTSQPGPQRGEQPRSPDQWDRAPASGSTAERGCLPLFPPGPGDAAAWGDTIATAPDLAPATGIGDCFAWAGNLAQTLAQPEQAAAEPAVRRMADGLAARSRALRLLGNGVCPLAAAYAWRALASAHGLGAVDLGAARGPERAGAA